MKLFFCILSISALCCSCISSSTNKLDDALKIVIAKNSCDIALKSRSEASKQQLELTYRCNSNDLFAGKLLDDIYPELHRRGLIFDQFLISNSNKRILELSNDEIKRIMDLKKAFYLESDYLINKKFDYFYQNVNPDLQATLNYDVFVHNMESTLDRSYSKFDGFVLSLIGNDMYVMFSRSNESKHIHLTYKLNEPMSVIQGMDIN